MPVVDVDVDVDAGLEGVTEKGGKDEVKRLLRLRLRDDVEGPRDDGDVDKLGSHLFIGGFLKITVGNEQQCTFTHLLFIAGSRIALQGLPLITY